MMSNNLSHKHTKSDHRSIEEDHSLFNVRNFLSDNLQNHSIPSSNFNGCGESSDPPPLPAKNLLIKSKMANLKLSEDSYYNIQTNPFRNFGNNLSSNAVDINRVSPVKETIEKFNSQPNLNLNGGIYQNNTAESVHEYQSIYDDNNSIYESLDDYRYNKDAFASSNRNLRQIPDRRSNSRARGRIQDRYARNQYDLEKKIGEILESKLRRGSKFESDRSSRYNSSDHKTYFTSEDDFNREITARIERILDSKLGDSYVNKNTKRDYYFDDIDEKLSARIEAIITERNKKDKIIEEKPTEKLTEKKNDISQLESRLEKKMIKILEKQKSELLAVNRKTEVVVANNEDYRVNSKVSNWQKEIQRKIPNYDIYDSRSNYQTYDSRKVLSNKKPSPNESTIDFSGKKGGEFQIILLGGTGTGKSTLINTMANYFLGGTLSNPKVVIPTKYIRATEKNFSSAHSEAALDDVTKSKTTKCHNYSFTHPQNSALKFIFIDTPGLSDTNGTKQDDENIQEIINTAITVGSISALIVIANGTEARVTPSIRNTLVRLANNLPDVLIDSNLLLVLTKCSKNSACFSEDAFANEISEPKAIFYMDNQAFCSDPRTWKDDEDAYEELQLKWKQSNRTFDKLLQQITGMANTSTEAFKTMKDLRNKLKSEIATISLDIASIQKVQDSLEAAQKAMQITGDKKSSFANFKQTESITLKKIVPADYHSTVCTTHMLQDIVCHQDCGLEFNEQSGSNYFSCCACMGGGSTCTVCGCGPESHFHDMIELEEKTETIEKVLEDIKAQYDMADQDFNKFSSDANNFQSALNNLQAAADQKYNQIHQLCYDLSKICSRFNFVDELHANIENMKQEARMIKNTDLRKNAEDEIAKLIKLANDLSSNQRGSASSTANYRGKGDQIMNNFSLDSSGSNNSSKKNKGYLRNLFRK